MTEIKSRSIPLPTGAPVPFCWAQLGRVVVDRSADQALKVGGPGASEMLTCQGTGC